MFVLVIMVTVRAAQGVKDECRIKPFEFWKHFCESVCTCQVCLFVYTVGSWKEKVYHCEQADVFSLSHPLPHLQIP